MNLFVSPAYNLAPKMDHRQLARNCRIFKVVYLVVTDSILSAEQLLSKFLHSLTFCQAAVIIMTKTSVFATL